MSSTLSENREHTDVPELIPARMLNEFTYCPRLGYLEWVQGEFADNLETIEGRFGHRRVDRESRREVPAPAGHSASRAADNGEADSDTDSDRQRCPSPGGNGKQGERQECLSPGDNGQQGDRQESPPPAQDGDTRDGQECSSPGTGNTRDRQERPSPGDKEAARAAGSQPNGDAIHTRSLMLSSDAEGLIARMDLVDISAGEAVPVDYKRGRMPDNPEHCWEPERVQLCAQGLILRDNGYHCEGGILYFIESRRRVSVVFDEPLVERTRELIGRMREAARSGVMPPPLEDSPKCPRCSLVGICLPDETCLLTSRDELEKAPRVRRLVPTDDKALPLYVQEQGMAVGKSGDELTIKQKGKVVRKTRLLDVSQVSLFGNVQISAQALREITSRGIPVCHFSYGGWFHAATVGMTHKNVELRVAQFAKAADPCEALTLARSFIVGKIKNSRTLLRRHLKRGPGESNGTNNSSGENRLNGANGSNRANGSNGTSGSNGAARTNDPDRRLPRLAEMAAKAASADDAGTLLGIEGTAAKIYFGGLAGLFKGDAKFQLEGRNRRPPRDPVNALLSFVYSLLVKELTVTLFSVGFDPMLGFFHQPRYGRPSLALDLAEEFRPLIGDSVVLTLINNGEITSDSFLRKAGAFALTTAGRRAVLAAFERRMETLVTHPVFGYRISYRRILEVQARLLARTVLGEIESYPTFCTR